MTPEQIVDEELRLNARVVVVALAVLELGECGEPAWSGEVDCLGDVEPEVESLVVGR